MGEGERNNILTALMSIKPSSTWSSSWPVDLRDRCLESTKFGNSFTSELSKLSLLSRMEMRWTPSSKLGSLSTGRKSLLGVENGLKGATWGVKSTAKRQSDIGRFAAMFVTSFGRLVFTIDPRSELGIWILNPNSQHTILCVLIRLGHQCPVWSGYLIAWTTCT